MAFPLVPQHAPLPPESLPNSSLKKVDRRRLYSAIVFIPLLYVAIRYSPPWLFSLLLGMASMLALWEFLSLASGTTDVHGGKLASCLGAFILLFIMHKGFFSFLYPWMFGIIMIMLTGFLVSPAAMKHPLTSSAGFSFGMLYVAGLLGHFILLRQMDHGIALVFFVLIVTWLADTGGFVVGLSFGRHALAPILSPKKTIEGLIGGVLFSVIGAIISHFWFLPFFSLWECAMLGGGFALIGAVGDLSESAIKRSVSVKDSGTIIPGHGGILDRVDSLLLTGPALYYYVLLTTAV